MKKIFRVIIAQLLVVILLAGCDRTMEDLYQNPNKPVNSTPALNLTGILKDMLDAPAGMEERWSQYFLINYDYYGNNRYDFGEGSTYYGSLTNVVKMEEEAKRQGLPEVNPYAALSKFFKAYFFTKMSLQMGDIPMTQALKGLENLTPSYDSQKDVFKQSLSWLEDANTELATLIKNNDKTLAGDFYFNGKLENWQKTVNAFHIRLLIHLSKKVSDADLNVKGQFAAILGDPAKYPLMTSSADNLQFVFVYPTDPYPNNPSNFGFDALRYNTSATYIKVLTDRKDPRVFITAEPADSLVRKAHISPTSFDAFVGADPGEDLGIMYIKANNGKYSLLNRHHFYETFTGEPSIIVGYPELLFNIAEGINRGWAASGPLGTAEAHYKAGIQASMDFYGIPESGKLTAYFLHPGASLGTSDTYAVDVDFNAYYAQPLVQYAGNTAAGLNQILTQRYIALFRHSGLESYYTFRRTGVPNFTTGPGTGNSSRIAMRFKYPSIERNSNADNYSSALRNQFAGNDDINGVMWILQ
jgi:hypothetical protein